MKRFMNINHSAHFFLFLVLCCLLGCNSNNGNDPIKIAISKGQGSVGYEAYGKWLKKADSSVIYYDLYFKSLDSALILFDQCDALILSGGPDVYSVLHGKVADTLRCDPPDHKRDSLEFMLIEKALERGIPILGICRGMQILNVAMGGSLIIDIPDDYDTSIVHRCPHADTCYHNIKISEGSLLYQISGISKGIVNTNHHQAIDRLAESFEIIATTQDGLTEAIQWIDLKEKPFLLGVQWHPERMDTANILSLSIAKFFLKKARSFHKKVAESK